ncbi:hypothetical protein L5515_002175 [Caenorhabditis briggsae]|uniref:Uncharacterized protein n=1 Tax=Caenorhabditis briggsae TaxID=6238 RepID=A0AAE9J4S4_CAEBR|nr:hypothetical protein L5515_002175 [Caenorhabditis briggsae]
MRREPNPVLAVIGLVLGLLSGLIIRYLSVYFKSKKVGPISRFPFQPFNEIYMKVHDWPSRYQNLMSDVKILCGESLIKPRQQKESYHHAIEKVNQILTWIFNLDRRGLEPRYPKTWIQCVPQDARIVSIKMDCFEHGRLSHEFSPINGTSRGSYFTYQMYGDNRMQVTSYVKDGVSYLAGVCIYIDCPWTPAEYYRMDVVEKLFGEQRMRRRMESQWNLRENPFGPTIQQEASVESETVPVPEECLTEEDQDWTVKYCTRLQRKVMTCVKYGSVIHQEWNTSEKKMKKEKCGTCTGKLDESPPPYSSIFIEGCLVVDYKLII